MCAPELESSQLMSGISWSRSKADKFAACSAASSDVHIWNATRGVKELALSAHTRMHAGRVGLTAIQTLQVCYASFLHHQESFSAAETRSPAQQIAVLVAIYRVCQVRLLSQLVNMKGMGPIVTEHSVDVRKRFQLCWIDLHHNN